MFCTKSLLTVIWLYWEIGSVANPIRTNISFSFNVQDVCLLNPQNGQTHSTHSNNSSAFADELFECARPFCGFGT